jgi:hypothetical protein
VRVISANCEVVAETKEIRIKQDNNGMFVLVADGGDALEAFETEDDALKRMACVFEATKTGRGWFDFAE